MKLGLLCFVLVSSLSGVSFGENIKCRSCLVDFDEQHLGCLKRHVATKSIGKIYPSRRYIVIGIKEQPFGGFSILVLFENEPYAHQLWLYPIDTEEFQLRNIEIQKFSKKFTRQMLEDAKEPKFAKYWTSAL